MNDEIRQFKDFLQSYCDEHKKKLNDFNVGVMWKKNCMLKKTRFLFRAQLHFKKHLCSSQLWLNRQYMYKYHHSSF